MGTAIGYLLRRAQVQVFQDFSETFVPLGIRPAEFSALARIAECAGQRQTELAEGLGINPANMVTLLDGLERRGLVERRKSETDRRSHSVYLTDEGAKFVQQMGKLWRDHETRQVERLGGRAERDQLLALLKRLI